MKKDACNLCDAARVNASNKKYTAVFGASQLLRQTGQVTSCGADVVSVKSVKYEQYKVHFIVSCHLLIFVSKIVD